MLYTLMTQTIPFFTIILGHTVYADWNVHNLEIDIVT